MPSIRRPNAHAGVSNVFSPQTLQKFEDAAASIVLRQIDRAFEGANIRVGEDPGGLGGDRRTQFRRYVAGVDQHDPQQLDRLGDALGALVAAAATSKEEFLVKAAEGDGFLFADGVFRPAGSGSSSLAMARVEDLGSIDDRGRRLALLAHDRPQDATCGAKELVESVCRTVLRHVGEPAPGQTADVARIVKATLASLELASPGTGDAKSRGAVVRRCLEKLSAVVADLGELQSISPRHARLAVGSAVTFAGFVAETYVERTALKDA